MTNDELFRLVVRRQSALCMSSTAEKPLGGYRVIATSAPRVAPQKTPSCKHRAPQYAVLLDRLGRIARAGGGISTSLRECRRYDSLIKEDWKARDEPQSTPCPISHSLARYLW